jgi:AraC-like DNA-binding protein
MGRPRKESPLPSVLAPALLRYLRQRGAGEAAVAARFDLPSDAAEREEISLAPTTLNELLAITAEALGEPHLGLRLATELPLRRYGLAELAARASSTVRGALESVSRFAALVHPQLDCTLEVDNDHAHFHVRAESQPRNAARHVHEYGLAYALTQCRAGAVHPVSPSRVWFAHARPADLVPLYSFFEVRDLDFGYPDSGFTIGSNHLEAPTQHGDPRLLATVEGVADAALRALPRQNRVSALLTHRLETLLPAEATIEAASRVLHMSPRTLQRRLEDEGTRFSEVLDSARADLARRWLTDKTQSLTEVAFRLGFSDLATFSRAFKRWTGKPPGMWRQG